MRLSRFAAVLTALAACALLTAPPAEAAVKKKTVAKRGVIGQQTMFINRDESGRTRTRIIVQRRSYLDAGTEVLPGERKFNDYAMPPNYSVTGVIDNTAFSRGSRMFGRFDLPSRNNPFSW